MCLASGGVAAQVVITTILGNGQNGWAGDFVLGSASPSWPPYSVFVAPNGDVYASLRSDAGPGLIRRIYPNGTVVNVVGSMIPPASPSAYVITTVLGVSLVKAVSAPLQQPSKIAWNPANSAFWVSDGYCNCVRMVTTDGNIHMYAGGTAGGFSGGYSGDGGPATNAVLNAPSSLAWDAALQRLYIVDAQK